MHRKIVIILLGLLLVIGAVVLSEEEGDESYDELISLAERLWLERKYDECEAVCDRLMARFPDRADPYWRKARVIYDRYEDLPRDQKPEEEVLLESFRRIERLSRICLDKEPDNACCILWLCVGLARRGTTEGMVSMVDIAPEMERLLIRGIELGPDYRAADGSSHALGDLYEMLGQYYRIVPEWLCAFPFKQIVGTCGDLEKSVRMNRAAYELDPERIEYIKELGISLVCYGRKREREDKIKEGVGFLKMVEQIPAKKPQDEVDKAHARMLIQNPELCCGYSRDKQQVQDKEAYLDK